jgi:hypothetical protein
MSPNQTLVRISEGSPGPSREGLFCSNGAFIFYFSSGLNYTATHRHTLLFVICEHLLQDYFFKYFENSTLDITMIDDYLGIDIAVCHLHVTT